MVSTVTIAQAFEHRSGLQTIPVTHPTGSIFHNYYEPSVDFHDPTTDDEDNNSGVLYYGQVMDLVDARNSGVSKTMSSLE